MPARMRISPFSQAQRMDAELTRLGRTHQLIIFDGQPHVIGGRGAERDAAALGWFKKFGARARRPQ